MSDWEWQYSLYRLKVRAPLGARTSAAATEREGFLLRLRPAGEADAPWGYTDFFFWPELGDPSSHQVLKQLQSLGHGTPTQEAVFLKSIASRLQWAIHDQARRRDARSAWLGLPEVRSHALLPSLLFHSDAEWGRRLEEIARQGFREVKLKVGRDLEREAAWLSTWVPRFTNLFQWRLDANESFADAESFFRFWEKIAEPAQRKVEWIEDPTSQCGEQWQLIQNQTKVILARDFARESSENSGGYAVRVLKPARDLWKETLNRFGDPQASKGIASHMRFCVTSYLGHPLEQMMSLHWAGEWSRHFPGRMTSGGLVSHTAYELNAYSASIPQTGPILSPPSGKGWGWDALLESETWNNGGRFVEFSAISDEGGTPS